MFTKTTELNNGHWFKRKQKSVSISKHLSFVITSPFLNFFVLPDFSNEWKFKRETLCHPFHILTCNLALSYLQSTLTNKLLPQIEKIPDYFTFPLPHLPAPAPRPNFTVSSFNSTRGQAALLSSSKTNGKIKLSASHQLLLQAIPVTPTERLQMDSNVMKQKQTKNHENLQNTQLSTLLGRMLTAKYYWLDLLIYLCIYRLWGRRGDERPGTYL